MAVYPIDRIADKFYISAVEPLGDKRRIDELGVTHILNAAQEHLYSRAGGPGRHEGITYKVMAWDDNDTLIISPQLREAADFIEQGVAAGGIIVHCSAGISRSASCCIAYLMVKKRMSLNSAYKLVFCAREIARPNQGFWRQLRELEGQLVEAGGPLDDSYLLTKLDYERDRKALGQIEALDNESRTKASLGTAVTFRLEVDDCAAARTQLKNMRDENLIIGGIVHNVSTLSDTAVGVRVWINFEGKPVEDVLGRIQEQFIQKVKGASKVENDLLTEAQEFPVQERQTPRGTPKFDEDDDDTPSFGSFNSDDEPPS